MNSEWRKFLESAGAVIEAGKVSHYGNPEHETRTVVTGSVIADLSHRAFITVQGADALSFLQGQLTANMKEVDDKHSRLGAMCSPKGRMLASLRIMRQGDTYYLGLPEELLETTLKRLRMYVLRAKVILGQPEVDWQHIGFSAPQADKMLQATLGAVPSKIDEVVQLQELSMVLIPGIYPRYEIMGAQDIVSKLWTQLRRHAAPVGAGPWELLDIRAGLPTIYLQTVEAFVPQMANLDLIGGVSLNKGCYTGQEVVARTHYLGKSKRRMYLLYCMDNKLYHPGDPIYNKETHASEHIGTVVSAQFSPDGGTEMLAVLQIESTQLGELRLGSWSGPRCEVRALPYSV